MPRRRLWALTSLFLLLAPALAADVHADFSFYPVGAQDCLSQAATTSKCDGNTVMDLNTCLCGNWGNFVILTAICIGKNDKADSVPVYKTMVSACADSNTPLNVAPDVFYGAVNGQLTMTASAATTMTTSTTTSATTSATTTTTTTATPTGTSTAAPVSENLSTGATIGIALGASFGGVGAIAGLVYFLLRRSKKQGEEFHPMLPNSTEEARPFGGQHPPLSEPTPSPGIASTFSEAKRASWVSPLQSPDPYRYSAATWDATQGAYQGPYAPPEGAVELPPQTASVASSASGMVFEMDATTSQLSSGPVEIQGDVPPFTDHGRR
ncbi:uncharacterized protein Triagg1_3312 [Trichoderma aggressivum f. europaeum]|uniref:Extracellular membrane protein CFEM domain-containing protein n=1 Tax=Trichoderma aggressivum f. europaeum TaxID=173218 RepID=A0AAE1M774_9HYPO|nr:hypothetical protein Triagg1_3312 [Trichoderma aggressivum f. europaeum]